VTKHFLALLPLKRFDHDLAKKFLAAREKESLTAFMVANPDFFLDPD
jgi:hypothetical protein